MKTTTLAVAAAMAAGTLAHAQEAVQWRIEDGGNGHWYRIGVTPDLLQWSVARAIAISNGGDLASLETPEEQTFCFESFSPATTPNAWRPQAPGSNALMGPWIGATQDVDGDEPIGGWRWLSGTRLNPAGPYCCNDDCGDADENRLHFYRLPNGSVGWNDLPDDPSPCVVGDAVISLLIEFSADCNGDGIVDYGQCRDGSLPDYNGNNIPDCCEQGLPCEVGSYPVQWRKEDGGNGHWYSGEPLPPDGRSWTESRAIAQERAGDLVSLNTPEERSWVFNAIARHPALWTTTLGPWVGGYQLPGSVEPGGGWMWVDGTPVYDGFYWDGYHPDGNDNCGGPANFMTYWGDYVQGPGDLFADGPDVRRWTCWNIDFGTRPSLVIEWSADCNGDGIVDYGQILLGELGDSNANGVPDVCECDADINDDGTVNGADISVLLGYWGQSGKNVVGDITGDGIVNGADLALLLGSWGPCQ